MLRTRAQRNASQSSSHHGVTLLNQAGKWHAQITIEGSEIDLGLHTDEQSAARAFDRAAIIHGLHDGQKGVTNFDTSTYSDEMDMLSAISPDAFAAAMTQEEQRQGLFEMLGQGFTASGARTIFHSSVQSAGRKGSAAQGRTPKAHRELQALQRDGSGSTPAPINPNKPTTRKRRLADTSFSVPPAAATGSGSTAAMTDDQSEGLQASEPAKELAQQSASYGSKASSVRGKARPSKRGANMDIKASHVVDKSSAGEGAPVMSTSGVDTSTSRLADANLAGNSKHTVTANGGTLKADNSNADNMTGANRGKETAPAASSSGRHQADKADDNTMANPDPSQQAASSSQTPTRSDSHHMPANGQLDNNARQKKSRAPSVPADQKAGAEAKHAAQATRVRDGFDSSAETERDKRVFARQMRTAAKSTPGAAAKEPVEDARANAEDLARGGRLPASAPAATRTSKPAQLVVATAADGANADVTAPSEQPQASVSPPADAEAHQHPTADVPKEAISESWANASLARDDRTNALSWNQTASGSELLSHGNAARAAPNGPSQMPGLRSPSEKRGGAVVSHPSQASGLAVTGPHPTSQVFRAASTSPSQTGTANGTRAAADRPSQAGGATGAALPAPAQAATAGPSNSPTQPEPVTNTQAATSKPDAQAAEQADASAQTQTGKGLSAGPELAKPMDIDLPGTGTGAGLQQPPTAVATAVQPLADQAPAADAAHHSYCVAQESRSPARQSPVLNTPDVSPAACHPAPHPTPVTGSPLQGSGMPNGQAPSAVSSPFAASAAQQPSNHLQAGMTHASSMPHPAGMTHSAAPTYPVGSAQQGQHAQQAQPVPSPWLSTSGSGGGNFAPYGHGALQPQDPRGIARSPALTASSRPASLVGSPTHIKDPAAAAKRPEATRAASGLSHQSGKASTQSNAIAAAARANAAAANAIAESGALTKSNALSFTGNSPAGHFASAPAASGAGYMAGAPLVIPGAVSAGRAGLQQPGQRYALPASQAGAAPDHMTHQQQLNGVAMMTAMQLPGSGAAAQSAARPFHMTNSPGITAYGQHASTSPRYVSTPSVRPNHLNSNFSAPSGPPPFKAPSVSPNAGARANPSFVPSSTASGPAMPASSSAGLYPGANPAQQAGFGIPFGSGFQPAASGLPNPAVNPVADMASGPQGMTNQVPWPNASSASLAYRGGPSHAHPSPHPGPHPSLPAGAQVTPSRSRAQQSPQLAAQASTAMDLQPHQPSRGMTNAHTIVPGMLPGPSPPPGTTSNTPWKVGLAAGLAATANLRAPSPSAGHQAATTAAAARAAAAFQASRALTSAKAQPQPSPLLQQGAGPIGPLTVPDGSHLAGPSTSPSSGFSGPPPATAAAASRPLITSGQAATNKGGAEATAAGASPAGPRAAPAVAAAGHFQSIHPQIASHEAFARQTLPPHTATAVAPAAGQPGAAPTASTGIAPPTALPGKPVPQPGVATAFSAAEQMPYSAEAQALYRARAQAVQPQYSAATRPYMSHPQSTGTLPPSYVSFSQAPYNAQTHTPYIAPAQLPYMAQNQPGYRPPSHSGYGLQSQVQYPTAARYATAAQPYATAAPQPLQPRPTARPPLNVEHVTFSKLAPQPQNAIDIISDDAVLPTFPLKKKKPKKRKYAGLEAFAAEVHRHKQLAESKHDVLQSQDDGKSPISKPKDFRPRMPKADQQAAQPTPSVSSLAPKPKGKTAKGPKGKQAAAADKARKDDKPKKSDRVAWDAQKRRSLDRGLSDKQYANVARLHQEQTAMDHLLGALGQELEAYEAEEGSGSDNGQVSGTEQGGPSRASGSKAGRGVPMKRGRGAKAAARGAAAARGRGRGRGNKEGTAAKGGRGHKRAASSSPDRGPLKTNRRKLQAPARAM